MATIKREGKYQLKSDEDLFNRWQGLKEYVDLLAGIVQNDMEGTGEDIEGFVKGLEITKLELDDLAKKTMEHLASTIQEIESPPGEEKYKIVYEDSDGKIIKDYITADEYTELLRTEDTGAIEILKHPKFST
jgi:hypothetical protein